MNLDKCEICPHKCGIDRTKKEIGRCKSTDKKKIALYSVHHFEEPCISGENGSGTVFFSNCNLNCIYCQNYEISQEGKGKEISIEEVRAVLAAKTQAGKRREVKELLLKYDSGKLSGVKPENYAALMADAEAL